MAEVTPIDLVKKATARAEKRQRFGISMSWDEFFALFRAVADGQGSLVAVDIDHREDEKRHEMTHIVDWHPSGDGKVFRFHCWTYELLAAELAKQGITNPFT